MATGAELLRQKLTSPQAVSAWQRWVAAVPQPSAIPTVGPMGESQYLAQQNAINNQYAIQKAQSLFQQGNAEAEFGPQMDELKRKFLMMRRQMPYEANRRGMLGSGLWREQLGEYERQRKFALGGLARQQDAALGNFRFDRLGMVSGRDRQLADLQAAMASARQQRALQGLNLGLGG